MKRRIISLLLSLAVALVSCTRAAETESVVEGNTAFGIDLYAALSGTSGNLFFSPYSISTCLAMTYAGARGDTERQISQVLHFGTNQNHFHASFGELQRRLDEGNKRKGIQLDIANALWAQQGEAFLSPFLQIARNNYQADVKRADFNNADLVAGEINSWVAKKTADKIQQVLPPDSVDPLTRLVLVDAVYFKGAWAAVFDKASTSIQSFHRATDSEVDVPFMTQSSFVYYTETNDFQALELPYKGNQLSMLIVLSRQIGGLRQLEKQLSPTFVDDLLAQLKRQSVDILLPKFKMKYSVSLNDTLANMGMPDAFGSRADFSGLDGTKSLYVSRLFHKAWLDVTEEGTEAAAATSEAFSLRGGERTKPVFCANHPFVFMIRDNRSGSLLFMGRLADPKS